MTAYDMCPEQELNNRLSFYFFIINVREPSKHKPLNHRCSMLGQRRRRWTNIEPTMVQRLVFADNTLIIVSINESFTKYYNIGLASDPGLSEGEVFHRLSACQARFLTCNLKV